MKKLLLGWLLCLGCLLFSLESRAVAPVNDLCSGALVVPGAGPFPYLTQVITNISEATTNGDPALSCQPDKSRSVWFKFVPTVSATYVFSTGADTATALPDTVMGLYQGNTCSSPLTERSCADDVPMDLRAAFATNLTANTTYFLVVWIYNTNAPAVEQDALQLKVSRPGIITNDFCSGAQIIPAGGPFPYLTPVTDITLASTNSDPPISECQVVSRFARSIWYRFNPSNTVSYTFSTCLDTETTVTDTVMAIYRSDNGCGGPLSPVACNDEACVANRAMISATLTNGESYYVVVWEYGTDAPVPGQTSVQLKVSLPAPMFTGVQKLATNSYRLSLAGYPGQVYSIEASTNLLDWFPVGSPTNLSGTNYQLTLTNAVAPGYRFFRATGP